MQAQLDMAMAANFQAIFDALDDAIMIHDMETGDIIAANEKMGEMFGYTAEEARRLDVTALCGEPDCSRSIQRLIAKAAAGEIFNWRAKDRHGRHFWTEVHLKPIVLDGQGRILGVIRDIDQRTRAEEALNTQARVLESMAEGVNVVDPEGRILLTNPAFDAMFGYDPQELLGQHVSVLNDCPDGENARLVATIMAHLQVQGAWSGELKNRRKDGTSFFTHARISTLELSGKQSWISVQEDITARKRVEEELRESEARYRIVTEGSLAGVYLIQNNKFRYVNPILAQAFGYRPGEIIDRLGPLDLVHPEDRPRIAGDIQRRLAGEESAGNHFRGVRRDGTTIFCEVLTRGVEFQGRPAVMGAFLDVTERHQAEEARRQAYEELERRVVERTAGLEEANARLQQEIEERRRTEKMIRLQRDLAMALSEAVGMEDTLRLCVETAFSISGMDSGAVYLVDSISGEVDLAYHQGLSPEFVEGVRHYAADSINAHLVMAGKPVFATLQDLPGLVDDAGMREGLRSVAIIPILHKGQVVACLNIASHAIEEVPEAGRAVLETIAAQVGSAIARVKAEEALREGEERFRAFMDHLPGISCMMDGENRLLYLNRNLEQIFQSIKDIGASGNFLGRSNDEIWPPEMAAKFIAENQQVLRTREAQQFIEPLSQEDGQHSWLLHKFPIMGGGSHPILVGCIGIDITAIKEAEEALRQAKADLEVSVAERTAQLQQANVSLQLELQERRKAEESLRQSEAKYRTLVEQIPAMTFIAALDDVVKPLYISPQVESMLGFTPEELLAGPDRFRQQIHLDDRDRVLTELILSYSQGGPFLSEYRMVAKDGRVVWIRDESRAVYDRDGRPLFMQGVALDITAHKEAQAALEEANIKIRALVDASPLGIFTHDVQGKVITWNPAAERIFGWQAEEVVGRPLPFIPEEKQVEFKSNLASVLKGESITGLELCRRKRDGSPIDISLSVAPLYDSAGRIHGVMGIIEDITRRRRTEEALRQSEARFRAIFEGAAIGIAQVDLQRQAQEVNPALQEMLGYRREEIRHMSVAEVTHPDDLAADMDLFSELVAGKRNRYQMEKRYIRRDGRMVRTRLSVSLVRDAAGEPQFAISMVEDITERKRAEEAAEAVRRQQEAILNNIADIAWLKDKEGRYIIVNEAFGMTCGLKPQELAGKTDLDLWPGHLAQKYRRDDQEVLTSGRKKRLEEPLEDQAGNLVWVETIKSPIWNEKREIVGTAGLARDITVRRHMEETLRKVSRALKAITECHQAMLRASSEPELLEEVCRIIVEVGGYPMAWVGFAARDAEKTVRPVAQTGFTEGYLDLVKVSWADVPLGRGPVGTAIRSGEPALCRDTRHDAKFAPWAKEAGKRGYASVLGLPLKDVQTFGALAIYASEINAFDDEEIELLRGLANDLAYGITALRVRAERRQAAEALRESEEKYRGLMNYASDAILLADAQGHITEANRQAEELLGYSKEELLVMHYQQLHPQADLKRMEQTFQEIITKGFGVFSDGMMRRKDGKLVPVDLTGSIIAFGNQRVVQGIIRDITAHKQAENVIRDSEEKLRSLTSQLFSVQERERRRVARELHDELGQALTVLKIHLVAIEDQLQPEQQDLRDGCEQLLNYIDGVIENVRRLSWDLSPSSLEDLGLSASLGYLIEEICRNNAMRCAVSMDRIDQLFSPETQINIYRIFQESLTNIVRHAQATQISVTIKRKDGNVSFVVRDNGKGFDKEEALSRRAPQRSLGLTAMQERALMANGALQIKSHPGKGTRIAFTIPVDHLRE